MTSSFSIAQHQVHLWRCDLRTSLLDRGFVSTQEEARAQAFVFERDQVRYRRGRVLMRLLLARYVGARPSELVIPAHAHVKPEISNARELRFNVSHSGDVYVLAVSHFEVGVDVEVAREADDALQLGPNVFSRTENTTLQIVPAADRSHAFLLGWTRKEAFVKALGIGLGGVDLTAITVGLETQNRTVPPLPGISARPIEIRSHRAGGEYIASACDPAVTDVALHEINEGRLKTVV